MCDYELPSVFSETRPVAAKPHRCCECYMEIPKGAKYHHAKGLWDGRWATYKTCEACDEQRDNYRLEIGEAPPFEGLREWCVNSDIAFWVDAKEGMDE